MTLSDFCIETATIAVGSSHHVMHIIDKVLPDWAHWAWAHVCAWVLIIKGKYWNK
jgi:hypothetical protein